MQFLLRKKLSIGWLLFLTCLSVYVLTMTGRVRFGDEGERYLSAQSIVERQDLAIRIQPDLHRKIGVDGRNYSSYELGSILPLVPFYWGGSQLARVLAPGDPNPVAMLFTGLLNPFLTALTVVLLFKAGQSLGYSSRAALATAALYGLGTLAWPYARSFEREPVLALALLFACYAAWRFRQAFQVKWAWLLGLSLGFLCFAKIANVILLPFFALYFGLSLTRGARPPLRRLFWMLAAFGIPIAAQVALLGLYNQMRFGSFTSTGLEGTWGSPLAYFSLANIGVALSGMLFSPAKSFLLYSPPVLLGAAGWLAFLRQKRLEALLIGTVFAASVLFNAMNANWDQSSWWGLKYLVPVVPLAALPIGALEAATKTHRRHAWILTGLVIGVVGVAVQVAGSLVDERDHLDIMGRGIDLAGAVDFLRHGAIDSWVVYLSPTGFPVQVNPFGLLLGVVIVGLGIWIVRSARRGEAPQTCWIVPLGLLSLLCIAFVTWIVVPYTEVMAARGDTRFVAGNLFLAEGRQREAIGMYQMALDRGTHYTAEAVGHLENLQPRAGGESFSAIDLMSRVEVPAKGSVAKDEDTTLFGQGSLRIELPPGQDDIVSASTDPIAVEPNACYEISGWIKVQGAYGSGYAVVTVHEDDGAWEHQRGTDIVTVDETSGWRLFRKAITTLPTTRRLLIATRLWKTFGTVWVDGVELGRIAPK